MKPRRLERNREALAHPGADHCASWSPTSRSTASASRCARSPIRVSRTSERFALHRQRHRIDALAVAAAARARRAAITASTGSQLRARLSFLVILPIGEHFHIVTALPALFFRRGRPAPTSFLRSTSRRRWPERRSRDARRRAQRSRPHLEGRPRRVHLHRVRPLQGRVPHLPHRQAAVAQVGERQPEAPPARAARARSSRASPTSACRRSSPSVISDETLWACTTCGYCEAACPIELEHLPQVLPAAPAPGDDGRRVSTRAARRLRRLRSAEQSVGSARRTRAATGPCAAGVPILRDAARRSEPRLSLLRGLGRVVRCARTEDRRRLRQRPQARPASSSRSWARARRRPASACAAPATRCCSSSLRATLIATLHGVRHPADRDLRPACLQHAARTNTLRSAGTTRSSTTRS